MSLIREKHVRIVSIGQSNLVSSIFEYYAMFWSRRGLVSIGLLTILGCLLLVEDQASFPNMALVALKMIGIIIFMLFLQMLIVTIAAWRFKTIHLWLLNGPVAIILLVVSMQIQLPAPWHGLVIANILSAYILVECTSVYFSFLFRVQS